MVQNIASGVAEPLYTAESLNSIYLNKYIKGHPKDKAVAQKSLKRPVSTIRTGYFMIKIQTV